MSNRKNLANGILASAVNDTTTTWPLESGYGAGMPPVPFYITATPFGQLPTQGNSEIVNVTARSGDTLTVVRGAKGTTAKAFAAGAVVANAIYDDEKWTSDNIDWATFPPLRIERGFASRGNNVIDVPGIADDNWRYFRNDANTADLSLSLSVDEGDLYIEVMTVIWSNNNQYRNVRVVLDGAAVGDTMPMSYLSNGVAPGAITIKVPVTAGDHTIKLQWQRQGGASAQVSYRNVTIKAYQLVDVLA